MLHYSDHSTSGTIFEAVVGSLQMSEEFSSLPMQDSPATRERSRVLIVDDEPSIRALLEDALSEKCDCSLSASAADVRERLERGEVYDVILSDIDLGDGETGTDLVPLILRQSPETVVVMISGNRDLDDAIESMRGGAFDYIKKPFDLEYLELVVQRAIDHHTLLRDKRLYDEDLERIVKERTEQLNYLSFYDPLTDLPNRALFEDRVSHALHGAATETKAALILVSIDGFNKVQRTLGHTNSDLMLIETGKRLLAGVGKRATVSHYERDEFAILSQQFSSADEVASIAHEISDELRRPFLLAESEVVATCSIGISIAPENGEDLGSLMRNAAAALSLAKKDGGDGVRFYTPDMNERALARLKLETGLWRALERREFELFYQPKVDLVLGRVVGLEALLRWNSSEMGLVSPAEFVPLAEETGLILPLGEWVLSTAVQQAKSWRDKGFDLTIAVNLSARQLQQPGLAETVLAIVDSSGLEPQHLNLEITESSVIQNAEPAIATLKQLRDKGIQVSIDDFGTGYSSLSYLKTLPIDVIKIDRSFVKELPGNADDAALTVAIISLGHNLRMKVVAEGVETEEQRQFLEQVRCDEYQGYFFSRPLPAAEMEALLQNDSKPARVTV
jgi:diguanylate cyclase (GGDEF)-like protein